MSIISVKIGNNNMPSDKKSKPKSKGLLCKFDLDKATDLMTTEIIDIFERLDSIDVEISEKVSSFSTFVTGLSFGYEVGFNSLGLDLTEDKKVDIIANIDLIYKDWENEKMNDIDVWRDISNLIRSLG